VLQQSLIDMQFYVFDKKASLNSIAWKGNTFHVLACPTKSQKYSSISATSLQGWCS